jgi:hypothetical protein
MKYYLIAILLLFTVGCTATVQEKKSDLYQARALATDSECLQVGSLTDVSSYNEITKTWWIDLEMKKEYEKQSCNPACVISLETKTAEVNWRCTGALNPKEICEQAGGIWKEDYKECLSVNKEICDRIGGTFNECASACRHDPNAQFCTQQCVIVCTIA